MAQFNDDNTLEDIHGFILVADGWPEFWQDLDIHKKLAEIVSRIEEKLARNRNRVRRNWFVNALAFAKQAQQHYKAGDVQSGRRALRSTWEQLESGNKAHRRKTGFVAGSDGEVQHV